MSLTITAYSTALFSTWYFVDELGLLFDAGDGVTAGLLQKSRKIKHIFISHADRDHLAGLMQLNQLNADMCPTIYYPKDCASFPYMKAFFAQFDPHSIGTKWVGIEASDKIKIRADVYVEAIRNGHVAAAEGIAKSLSYKVFQSKQKLKPELAHLSNDEIKQLKIKQPNVSLTVEILTNLLSYSGDTPVEDTFRFHSSKILIHEATFLAKGDVIESPIKNKHSTLEEVMEMVHKIDLEHLILGHFSVRYSSDTIKSAVETLRKKWNITIPITLVLPGEIVHLKI
ncbi:MAG: hypothetical protein RLZZ292_2879 [Bacteroidota bacterium]|jgi:ribonuclease Z